MNNLAEKYFEGLMIEPTNVCNLRCPLCITGNGENKGPKGFMKFHQFKSIFSQIKNSRLNLIYLFGFGEPFLAPDIMKMIDYVGQNRILTIIHTNGTVLNKRMMDEFKKNYRLNISFSIDGLTQKSYSYYRRGGVLKKAMKNLKYLIDLKRKFNLFNVQIIWQFLIMRTNEHEILQVRKVAEEIGVDKLRLKTLSINENNPLHDEFASKNKKYRRAESKVPEKCQFINPGTPYILWDGDVVPCCHDFFRENIMGNVFKEKLLDIWNKEKYKKFREKQQKMENAFCYKRCGFRIPNSRIFFVEELSFKQADGAG